MNPVKLFLGVTVLMLTIAGIAASKKFANRIAWYCTQGFGTPKIRHCVNVIVPCPTNHLGNTCKFCFLFNGSNICTTVFTKGGLVNNIPQPCAGQPGGPVNNCISTLLYFPEN